MQDPPPPILLDNKGGDIVFPDVIHPLPIQLLVMAALAWVVFGPIIIYRATRRGRTALGIAVYAAGLLVAIATLMAVEWGWPGEPFAHRFSVLWRYLGSQLLVLGLGLAFVSVVLGQIIRRRRTPAKDPSGEA